jgi:PAS domain S-box-containing protein
MDRNNISKVGIESLIENLVNNLDHFLLIIDPDGTLLAVNDFARNILDRADCIGKPVWNLPGWTDAQAAEKSWRQGCTNAMRGTRITFVVEMEMRGFTKSNIAFSLSPVKDPGNTNVFLIAEARDLPAPSADAEKKMLAMDTESRFRLMVENIEDYAMFMVDLDGFITSWNRGAERVTGYADAEAIGRHFSMMYPKETLDREHAIHELRMAQIHGRYEEEGVRVRKNGTRYHAQVIVWRLDNKEGSTVGYAKITRDVTALKEAERALKDSEAKFRIITDVMPQMVWSALPDGTQDFINQQWTHFVGVAQCKSIAKHWLDLVHSDDREFVYTTWQECLAHGTDFEAQFRLPHSSGSYRWVLGRALPLRDEQEKIIRWMGTVTDIHEQKRAENSLHNSARRKDEYLAMLAHELRNPLAPIRNSTELLRRLNKSSEVIMGIDVIDRQVAHMTRLIDDLLDVARISRGKIELRREAFELGELIQQAVNDFSSSYENKQVNLKFNLPPQPVWLFADPTRIAQVLGNLLHNALKFTGSNGEVCIALAEETGDEKSYAVVSVRDNGVGIDPNLLEHLFEPFVQGDQDLARSNGGLGLGLALIKGFASLHGGTIQARSAGVGYGSEFIFRIPLGSGVMPRNKLPSVAPVIAPLKVILIDDNRDMVETLASLLSMDGHQVKCAYDGESGLALIKTARPDLVFCDIGLPGKLDGYAIARHVREDHSTSHIFMVALSGYGQEKDKKMAIECGFDEYMLKPIDFDGLIKMISAARRPEPVQ